MAGASLRLFSGNLAKRAGATRTKQIAAISALNPDIIALQEVTPAAVEEFRAALGVSAEDTALAATRYGASSCNMVLSLWPLTRLPSPVVPSPERILSVVVSSPWGPIELYNAHILDGSSNGWDKVLMLEGFYAWLTSAERPVGHRILCGDLNCPDRELEDGRIMTSDQTIDAQGAIHPFGPWKDKFGRKDKGERWDRAERAMLEGIGTAPNGLDDIYRRLHLTTQLPYKPDSSWWTKRLDHILASKTLDAVKCRYLHQWRSGKEPISDHSAMLAVLAPKPL